MQGKYYSIVELATRLHISSLQALDIFYNSESYQRIVHRLGDLYLMSDAYIVDELMRELQKDKVDISLVFLLLAVLHSLFNSRY